MAASSEVQPIRFQSSKQQSSPLEILELSELRKRPLDFTISNPSRLDFHILHFITHGKGAHWIDFNSIPLQAGEILHLRPSQVHTVEPAATHDAFLVLFQPKAAPVPNDLHQICLAHDPVIRPSSEDFDHLCNLVHCAFQLQSRPGAIDPSRMAPGILGALLAGVSDLRAQDPSLSTQLASRSHDLTYQFEQMVDRAFSHHRELAWYLDQLHVSGRTLARATHLTRKVSPKRLLDLRITLEAKRLLFLTNQTIDEISHLLGFSEATNFVKFFKRLEGVTPDAFRQEPVNS